MTCAALLPSNAAKRASVSLPQAGTTCQRLQLLSPLHLQITDGQATKEFSIEEQEATGL
jgi:hypothetical protein